MSEEKKCGIIMPIAPMQGYTGEHWKEVKNIIIQAAELVKEYNFKTEIVSDSDGEVEVIHKRIVQNIYNSEIVVCDISGKNANVLFELGMRLTFDKPTIIIKDDSTDFMFDTGVIEHLSYPKDLRYNKIVEFKEDLAKRIEKTYKKAVGDSTFSTFLGNFGEFKVPSLNQTTVSDVNQFMLDELKTLRSELSNISKEVSVKSKRKVIPSNLESVIDEYIKTYKDYGDENIVVQKEEFISFLENNGINPFAIDENTLKRLVDIGQRSYLPF